METSKCPVCQSDVIIDDEAVEGDLVDCVNCDAELEIISLKPTQLAKAGKNDDWANDNEDDEEYADDEESYDDEFDDEEGDDDYNDKDEN